MPSSSCQQTDDGFLMERSCRTVLPPTTYISHSGSSKPSSSAFEINKSLSSVHENNKLTSSVLESIKSPELVPKILLNSLREGHQMSLPRADTLKKPGLQQNLILSDSKELSSYQSADHRVVLPKILPGASSSQLQRRVILPKECPQPPETQPSLQTMVKHEQPSLQTMAKQSYEEELEFLKLKLRYMQNDIEFKKTQINSAKMKLKGSIATASKWNRNNQSRSISSNAVRTIQQTASSHVYHAQQAKLYHKPPATSWTTTATDSLPLAAATASISHNCLDVHDRSIPLVAVTQNNSDVASEGSKSSLATGRSTVSLVTESSKPSLITRSSKSYLTVGSHKSTLVAGSNKSSITIGSNKFSLAVESNKSIIATGSNKSSFTAESNTSSLVGVSNTFSSATIGNKPLLSPGCKRQPEMYIQSPHMTTNMTLGSWKPAVTSADVRIVCHSWVRSVPKYANTADSLSESVSSQQGGTASNQAVLLQAEENLSGFVPSNIGVQEAMPLCNVLAIPTGSQALVLDRLGGQPSSPMSRSVCGSPDKRQVMSPKLTSVISVTSNIAQTNSRIMSLAAVITEASTSFSSANTKIMASRKGPSYYTQSEIKSGNEPAWLTSSVMLENKYRLVKKPSNLTPIYSSRAPAVNSEVTPSFNNSSSSYITPNFGTEIMKGSQTIIPGSLNSHVMKTREPVSKYKLNRLSPQAAAYQAYPVKVFQKQPLSVLNQKGIERQNAKASHRFVSQYKLVKTSSHGSTIPNSEAADQVSSMVSPSSSFVSGINHDFVSAMPVAAARRASQGSRTSSRIPSLNISAAAKLVSKYKLKRLSPTSALQDSPLFCGRLSYKQSPSAHTQTGSKTYSSYSRNRKLNQKLTLDALIHSKVKCKKFNEQHNSHLTFLTKQHKIDKRSAGSQFPKFATASSSSLFQSQLKVDNRIKQETDRNVETSMPVCTDGNNFARRVAKGGLYKSPAIPKLSAKDRCTKHFWVNRGVSKVRLGTKGSSRYSWKKATSPAAQRSRFKWSRSNIQTQNLAWQQLRQKLQLLLMKKHQHSRYSYFKHPPLITASSNRSRRSQAKNYKTNLVTIDGVTYKSSMCKLTRTRPVLADSSGIVEAVAGDPGSPVASVRGNHRQRMRLISVSGVHFHMDSSGKKLCRTRPGTSTSVKKTVSNHADLKIVNYANRVVHRSIAIAAAKYKKNNRKPKTPHCKFFSRFGKCHRGASCPYIHDPDKVAVCTRFLRGRCEVKDCPFSHKASVNKMPVCLFYLRGSCSRESCPYLHVRVNPNAPVCKDFRNGFCALGEKCKKIHSNVCPSFAMTGTCSRRGTCTMLHRANRKEQELPLQDKPLSKKSSEDQNEQSRSNEPCSKTTSITPNLSVPLTVQSSFISLVTTTTNSIISPVTEPTPSFKSLETNYALPVISLVTTPIQAAISHESKSTPSFISLETIPVTSVVSLGTTSAPSFISLGTTSAPSFISLGTTSAPSFISLETVPTLPTVSLETTSAPSFISLETVPALPAVSLGTTPAPAFISLATRQQKEANEEQGHHLPARKPQSDLDAPTDPWPALDTGDQHSLVNIRPSFMDKTWSTLNN